MGGEQQAWLDAAGRVRLLTPAEEIHLGRQVRAAQAIPADATDPEQLRVLKRGRKAADRLATANLRLVYRLATPYRRLVPDHQFLDLLQAGAEGVLHAAQKFNPEAGYKFSTYSAWWIRQRIQTELDWHSRLIRVPTTICPELRKLPRVRQRLMAELGRPPTISELAAALELPTQEVVTALERARAPASLDQELNDGDGSTLGELQATPELPGDDQLEELLVLLAKLPRLQRRIVEAAYLPGRASLRDVARQEGLSLRDAQLLLSQALRRLRRQTNVEQLSLPVPRGPAAAGASRGERRKRSAGPPAADQLELFKRGRYGAPQPRRRGQRPRGSPPALRHKATAG